MHPWVLVETTHVTEFEYYFLSSNTFNCTNNLFDPYLPIHRTTFIALRFVLRPFTLGIGTVIVPWSIFF